jgi:hypothetical protein
MTAQEVLTILAVALFCYLFAYFADVDADLRDE